FELEEYDFVIVMGLDKAGENLVDVTFQISNPQVGSAQSAEAQTEPPSDIITVTAPDIVAAKELVNAIVPRKLNITHLRIVIVSEELAQSPLFHHILNSSTGDPDTR